MMDDATIVRHCAAVCADPEPEGCQKYDSMLAKHYRLHWCEFHSDKGGLSTEQFERLVCHHACPRLESHTMRQRLKEL